MTTEAIDLKAFAAYFKEFGTTAEHWTYKEYETPAGQRQELSFLQGNAILMYLPDHTWSAFALATKEMKVYDHLRYAIQEAASWFAEATDGMTWYLRIAGAMTYQSIVPLKALASWTIEDIYAHGTLNGKERKYLEAVTIKVNK